MHPLQPARRPVLLAGLCVVAAGAAFTPPARAQQFAVTDLTYTATAQNTTDSHFYTTPRAGTPSNWKTPINYAGGSIHVRFAVSSKPSTRKTKLNICFEGSPTAACLPLSPPYTAAGSYEFSTPFANLWQYAQVDWSKPINKVALILKDENGTKVQGDPEFYPTTMHTIVTIVAPGAAYVPPGVPPARDAGAPDARVATPDAAVSPRDAGVSDNPGTGGTVIILPEPDPVDPDPMPAGGEGGGGGDGAGGETGQSEPDDDDDDRGAGGCSLSGARSAPGLWLALVAAGGLWRRARRGKTRRAP